MSEEEKIRNAKRRMSRLNKKYEEIIDKLEVDKTYLSKILSTLVIKGFIKKKPVVRRIKKSECYFTIIINSSFNLKSIL